MKDGVGHRPQRSRAAASSSSLGRGRIIADRGSAPPGIPGSAPDRRSRRSPGPRPGPRIPVSPASAARNVAAATASAPVGSTTSRARSASSRTAAAISASSTVTMSSTSRWMWANVRGARFVRAPSAIVRRLRSRGHATSSPPRNDSWASAASAGSTPTIRAFGCSARTAVAIPLMSPPPPIGTSSAPRSSTASAISSPAVPWPAITSSLSYEWMNGMPCSSAYDARGLLVRHGSERVDQ